MKKTAFLLAFLAVLLNFRTSFAEDVALDEVKMLQMVFQSEVSDMAITDQIYLDAVIGYVQDKLAQSQHAQESQYFVFADRNEKRQNTMTGFFNANGNSITIIGWARISTGDPTRSRHWETPTGIFENKISNPSFRARGTKNARGWRGFGIKGSKVWDMGWQKSSRKGFPATIRFRKEKPSGSPAGI